MKIKKIRYTVLGLLVVLVSSLFISCEADFNPNEEWTEGMLVYCLLDQDDTNTYIRVEKCFLGRGNAYEYAKKRDSLYYNPDDLEVKLVGYKDTNAVGTEKTFIFSYTYMDRNDTAYYNGKDCPIYYCKTLGQLKNYPYYRLYIKNKKTGKEVSSSTNLLTDYEIETASLTFNEGTANNEYSQVKWTNSINGQNTPYYRLGKRYELMIRFSYTQNSLLKHIDIPIASINNVNSSWAEMSANVKLSHLVATIENALSGQEGLVWNSANPVTIKVSAMDLNLFDYISISNASSSSLNFNPIYSNIEGGYGLFASRRTHVEKKLGENQVRKLSAKIGHLFQ